MPMLIKFTVQYARNIKELDLDSFFSTKIYYIENNLGFHLTNNFVFAQYLKDYSSSFTQFHQILINLVNY